MDMQTIIDDWRANAERHVDRNFAFLHSLKQKKGFTFRTYGVADNSLVCPAVFYIIEKMRGRR